jgi:hypothetical protein
MSDSLSEVKVVCKISCFSGDGDLLVLWWRCYSDNSVLLDNCCI